MGIFHQWQGGCLQLIGGLNTEEKSFKMIDIELQFALPVPWVEAHFQTNHIGEINFLVGPNGSGKSQFVRSLYGELQRLGLRTRLLGTDRLTGMEQTQAMASFVGDPFGEGLAKNQFPNLKRAGGQGAGIDAIVLLQERMDLLIQVEATLSHLFNREISLDWDSGRLVPRARRRGNNAQYRLDREECHGIKELLVLLTHLYDDHNQILIIDEPELNLHPQYQAFFLEEARKVAGNPKLDGKKKALFLVTHSPFILDLRSVDDLKSIVSFDLEYSIPKQVFELNIPISESFVRRLSAHHKQLFFSDNPIFVEGVHDAWIVQGVMETLGVSMSGAGSCVIDASGVEEVNQYLKLSKGLGKNAHFLYDLDALFIGKLRQCIDGDEAIQSILVTAGLGSSFGKYFGELEQEATALVDQLLSESLTHELAGLKAFLDKLGPRSEWQKDQHAKARVALMTAISKYKKEVISQSSQIDVNNIEARLTKILTALEEQNIHVLPGGTLERYLPLFKGAEFDPTPEQKRDAILAELAAMTTITSEEELASRYADLYGAIRNFPSKSSVNVDTVLRRRLATYIHNLQQTVVDYPDWGLDQVQERSNTSLSEYADVFSIQKLERQLGGKFQATIVVADLLNQGAKKVEVTELTNAGMSGFEIKAANFD